MSFFVLGHLKKGVNFQSYFSYIGSGFNKQFNI